MKVFEVLVSTVFHAAHLFPIPCQEKRSSVPQIIALPFAPYQFEHWVKYPLPTGTFLKFQRKNYE